MTLSDLNTTTACPRKQHGNPPATLSHELPRTLHSRQEVLRDNFFINVTSTYFSTDSNISTVPQRDPHTTRDPSRFQPSAVIV
jgi:hypothetical protein